MIRNVAAGSLSLLGMTEGDVLPRPLVEFYYKDDALNLLISEDHIAVFNLQRRGADRNRRSRQANKSAHDRGFCRCRNSPCRFQTGIRARKGDDGMRILLADEISPDSCGYGMSCRMRKWIKIASDKSGWNGRCLSAGRRAAGFDEQY